MADRATLPGMTDLDTAAPTGEPVDPATCPAIRLACEQCGTPTLLRPGGLCADCVAAVGLAADTAPYWAWRDRVSDEVTAGRQAVR